MESTFTKPNTLTGNWIAIQLQLLPGGYNSNMEKTLRFVFISF